MLMGDFARSTHAAVQAQLDRLHMASPAGDRLGLERIAALLERLGRPQDSLPPVFHVAGTNGKGSVVAMLRSALELSGLRVHAFTSPHLVRFNERIRVAGTLIEDTWLAALLTEVLDHSSAIEPSFFEVSTAVAFLAFARSQGDVCLLEVGLGGRLDATNVIATSLVGGIASIGLDHQQFLGSTLAEISAEKAGIARSEVPLVALSQPVEAEAAIVRVAQDAGAKLLLEGRDWSVDNSIKTNLVGEHQLRNANLAWQMLCAQDEFRVSKGQFVQSIGHVSWPARLQLLRSGPLTGGIETWLDGAHNPDSARALAQWLASRPPIHLILGIVAGKDSEGIVGPLSPFARSVTFVPVPGHDHHDPAVLARRHGGRSAASLADALGGLAGPRLIAGSLYLAGSALALNDELPQ